MNFRTKKILSILLGFTSAIGTVVTAVLVAKETPKAMKKIEELKKQENVKKRDYIKALVPIYWPAGVVCLGTIASTTVSNAISLKTEASLIATSTMLSQGWNKYKGKVKDIFGIEGEKHVSQDISAEEYNEKQMDKVPQTDDRKLYYEEHLGWFLCNERDLLTAIIDLNQRLHTPDPSPDGTFYFTTLAVLAKDAKARILDKEKFKACKNIGWTTDYLCEVYDLSCMWVHVYFTKACKRDTGEVLYTKLNFWEEPIFLNDSEVSREHYKSRADYEHEAEIDLHDDAAFNMYNCHGYQDVPGEEIERSMVNSKLDCDCVNDTGRRFQPSDMKSTTDYEWLEADPTLPQENDIPNIKEILKHGFDI